MPILMLLCVLASLLVPGIASASTVAGAETRVWAFDLAEQARVGNSTALTAELHPGCEPAYVRLASDSLLAAKGGGRAVDAATPIGWRGNPMHVPRGTNASTTIGGREFTGHAIDQMQGRGIMPSVVNDTIRTGVESAGRGGARSFTTDQLKVILNPSGSVETVIPQ